MSHSFLVTVETDGRIELPTRRVGGWSEGGDEQAVVEIRGPGELELTPLLAWAGARGVSAEEAVARINKAAEDIEPPGILAVHVASLSCRRRRARSWTVKLPETALWYLFPDGRGPAAPKRQKASASVLARLQGDAVFIWSERRAGYLDDGDLGGGEESSPRGV